MAMNVSAVRWWQWLGLSLLVGLLLGGARIYWEGKSSDSAAVMIGQAQFESLLEAPDDRGLGEITVYPPHDGFHFVAARQGNGRSVVYAAPVVFRPKSPVTLAGKTLSFRDYLGQMSVGYRYVWTDDWRVRLTMWVGGSVAAIGIAWPLLLMLLIKLGLAPPAPAREPAYDLDRFNAQEPAAAPTARAVTARDLEKLSVLEAELERNLRAGMAPLSSAPSAPSAAPQNISVEESSQLTPGSLRRDERFSATRAEPPMTQKPKEDKSYGGTFYPTVAHAPKKPSNGEDV
jgi:hypothetical protein